MLYVEAPDEYTGQSAAVFLAGGISNAEDWQAELVASLAGIDAAVLNPRRKDFPMGHPEEGRRQIAWEHRHLERADLVAFWFPPQTVCPITLFELGACSSSPTAIVVGTHPNYARRFDVTVQLGLRRPEVTVLRSLEDLARAISEHPALQGTIS